MGDAERRNTRLQRKHRAVNAGADDQVELAVMLQPGGNVEEDARTALAPAGKFVELHLRPDDIAQAHHAFAGDGGKVVTPQLHHFARMLDHIRSVRRIDDVGERRLEDFQPWDVLVAAHHRHAAELPAVGFDLPAKTYLLAKEQRRTAEHYGPVGESIVLEHI